MSAETLSAWQTPSPAAARPAARLRSPVLALVLLLGFALPVMRLLAFSGGRVNACAADVLLIPVLIALRGQWLRSGGLGAWVLALWLVNLVSWGLSISVLSSQTFLRESLKLITCYLYALAGFGIGRDSRTESALVKGLVLSALLMAAVGISAFFTRVPRSFIVDARVAGTLGDPNAFGIFLAMVLPLAASLRVAWLAIPLFIGAGVVSFSRTGLTAIISSLGLSLLNLGLRRYLMVAIACAVVFVGVYGAASQTTVGKRIANYEGSLEGRKELWSLAAETVATHPLLGVGKGNWRFASGRRTLPHNTFLSVMVDGGLIGFAVFIIPLLVWLARGVRRTVTRPWTIAVLIGLVGGLAVSLDNFRLFWVAVGVLVAQLMIGAAEPRTRPALVPAAQRAGHPYAPQDRQE
jgi:O-antigen ligase